jgi:ribonucleoside-diphosphate reductase beta chain
MMLAAFSGIETVHILAYALLLETLGLPDDEFSAFLEIPSMVAKVDYMDTFGVRTHDDILRTTAMFGGATEGLSLYGMFAMLMNFPRRNRMKGMGQIVSWSVRDESLHASLDHPPAQHPGRRSWAGVSAAVEADIVESSTSRCGSRTPSSTPPSRSARFRASPPAELKAYVRFVADWRLRQLRLPEQFGDRRAPAALAAVDAVGVEHQNFFEGRATEYSKAASRGSWHGDGGRLG